MRLLGAAAFACALGACAGASAPSSRWTLDDLFGLPAEADAYGDFLAARYAGMTDDPVGAAKFYRQAYDREPESAAALERAAFSTLVAGDVETAVRLAAGADPSVLAGSPFAQLALVVDDIAASRNRRALTRLQTARFGSINEDVARGLAAWLMAPDDIEGALERAAAPSSRRRIAGEQACLQGLILSSAGRDREALEKFDEGWRLGARQPLTTAAHVRLLAAMGDRAGAEAILTSYEDAFGSTPELRAAASMLSGAVPATPLRLSTKEGSAAAVYIVSAGSLTQTNAELATLYVSLALRLDPDFDLARIHLAGALRDQDRNADAIAELRRIDARSPYRLAASAEEAWLLHGLDRDADALRTADGLSAGLRDRVVSLRLAELYTALDRDGQAEALFNMVVERDAGEGRQDWRPLFARASSRLSLGRWDDAEADLVAALKIAPEQPEVLNFLGYAWVDRGANVEQGFALIKRALGHAPDAGYIVDSLGWAHYRMGEYEDAVEQLERAAELSPSDPVIADHLGDAYWRVDRLLEAGYAWRQALALEPAPALKASLADKVSGGLRDTASRAEAGGVRALQ